MAFDAAAYQAKLAEYMAQMGAANNAAQAGNGAGAGALIGNAPPPPPPPSGSGAGLGQLLGAYAVKRGLAALAPTSGGAATAETVSGLGDVGSGMLPALQAAQAGPTLAAAEGLGSGGLGASAGVATPEVLSASTIPGATGSAAAPGLGALGWLGPAAFIASAPIWAPVLDRAGTAVGKRLLGTTENNRVYDPAKLAQSGSPFFNRQLQGWDSAGQAQRAAALNLFHNLPTKNPGVMMPGMQDPQGNVIKDANMEYVASPLQYDMSKMWGDEGGGPRWTNDFRRTTSLDKQMDMYDAGQGQRLKPEYIDALRNALSGAKAILSGGGSAQKK